MGLFAVYRGLAAGFGNGANPSVALNTMAQQVVMDFATAAILDGRGYQVRSGTIATGIAAQSVIADQSADMCADAAVGTTIIPMDFRAGLRDVATSTTLQLYVKAVQGTASTTGTAFIPLPLKGGGVAAVSTARVQADTIVVAAELATTTVRLFEYENVFTEAPTTINANLGLGTIAASTTNLMRYVGTGISCIYVQAASTTAQVLWFGTLNYLELPTLLITPS